MALDVGPDERAARDDAQAAGDGIVEDVPGDARAYAVTLELWLDDGVREGHPAGLRAVLGVGDQIGTGRHLPASALGVIRDGNVRQRAAPLHARSVSSIAETMAHNDVRSPKSTEAARAAFRIVVPDDERVTVRPMFGSVAAFVGGNMFMGLVKDELFVRVGEADRTKLATLGGRALEIMPGRPMKEYVTLPDWQAAARQDDVRAWSLRALDYALTLPPKKK